MRVGLGQQIEQAQRLVMTPELRQAIAILQMNTLELSIFVEGELAQNPLLETLEVPSEGETETRESFDPALLRDPVPERAELADRSYDGGESRRRDDVEPSRFERETPALGPSLQEHLELQLRLAISDGLRRRVGEYIIGNIDEKGYLRITATEIAAAASVGEKIVREMIETIQSFDPPGVGAGDLAECLRIQLSQQGRLTPHLERILAEHLPDVAAGRLHRIAQRLKLTVGEVQAMVDRIRELDPKPGVGFGGERENRPLLPDVIIEKVDGDYVILVNDGALPRLTVNRTYRRILQEEGSAREAKQYVEDRLNSALSLIRAIEQRRLTLYKVVSVILEWQRPFFEQGLTALKPLTLRDVAQQAGVHESTVSRSVARKYAQTPRGLFELKFFFDHGVRTAVGQENPASGAIKPLIRQLVEAEDKRHPLSDQKIAEALCERGISLSRRTVAKYRDELGIPATTQRRRYN
ncbi:RNA polymerase factor sigma-54 [Heliobacterium gestii]|uniref:RNA polymerase factor sigma-54 n=1 Tax=Heliomicrobium gestii TaxID=2699 RepID=A0A845LCP3_HELGE|nr:RNA polymerase factor sigma-54 [Heliomicrobium gestii]MBM7868238.1 RNA polymerase sigma-54 factor [Heliomicrobium gestii]MZP44432.1 RNA polymerase factor sigma-54 [Heliomicrobium gestii]